MALENLADGDGQQQEQGSGQGTTSSNSDNSQDSGERPTSNTSELQTRTLLPPDQSPIIKR